MWKNPITYAHMDAYANSKLANAIYGQYLSRTLDPKNITVVTYAPGFIGDTGLMNAGLLQPLVKVMVESIIWFNSWWNDIPNVISTLERSCNFICRLATEDEYVKDTGRYYSIDHIGEANPDAYDISKQDQLVAFSLRLINEAGFD
ncbi:hypothetical protein BC833DRAFT_389345 [Globomyces pollinis-pini]|nr:hypothetical protein BC833DRAFT_389345 [Globomyces pollinis-pini]